MIYKVPCYIIPEEGETMSFHQKPLKNSQIKFDFDIPDLQPLIRALKALETRFRSTRNTNTNDSTDLLTRAITAATNVTMGGICSKINNSHADCISKARLRLYTELLYSLLKEFEKKNVENILFHSLV